MGSKALLIGKRFGRIAVIGDADNLGVKTAWICQCDCGTQKVIRGADLLSGKVQSCGCFRNERTGASRLTHGHTRGRTGTPTYIVWQNMITRCTNPSNSRYADYGGRGINVCERWRKFENFLADMGERPAGMSLERRDNGLGYSPDNCKWATAAEQALNKRPYRNNMSGFKGATFDKRYGTWNAHITMMGRQVYLGSFATGEAAHAAYCEARKKRTSEMRGN